MLVSFLYGRFVLAIGKDIFCLKETKYFKVFVKILIYLECRTSGNKNKTFKGVLVVFDKTESNIKLKS